LNRQEDFHMSELKGACIFGQSGGPTSVINASAYGVIATALKNPNITRVLGAEHGIKGVLNDRLFDMGQEDPAELELLKYTPSSALGSCRYKMADPDVMTRITSAFWRSSRSMTSVTSSITAVTIPWTPATRSPSICRRSAMTAA
jgi:hypothetical protein